LRNAYIYLLNYNEVKVNHDRLGATNLDAHSSPERSKGDTIKGLVRAGAGSLCRIEKWFSV